MENNDIWLVLRGKLFKSYGEVFQEVMGSNYEEIIEIVRAEKISKSYAKLKENTIYTPNISTGDILQIKPCEGISESSAVMEFSGYVEEDVEPNSFDKSLSSIGGVMDAEESTFEDYLKKRDSSLRPVVENSISNDTLFEPVKLISQGSYKINITFDAEDKSQLDEMKNHFNKWNVFFQHNLVKKIGSVSFGVDFKFKKAVDCLETAPYVSGCFLSFNPENFPLIDFDEDLIPKSKEEFD